MRHILAAEDDRSVRRLLESILTGVPDWSLHAVADGDSLLAALDTVDPSLVVLDVGLRGIHGLELYRLLRARVDTRDVPVLFITAIPGEVHRARLPGIYDVLAKPFEIDDLLRRAAYLMGDQLPDI